jgi:hypothetical protein
MQRSTPVCHKPQAACCRALLGLHLGRLAAPPSCCLLLILRLGSTSRIRSSGWQSQMRCNPQTPRQSPRCTLLQTHPRRCRANRLQLRPWRQLAALLQRTHHLQHQQRLSHLATWQASPVQRIQWHHLPAAGRLTRRLRRRLRRLPPSPVSCQVSSQVSGLADTQATLLLQPLGGIPQGPQPCHTRSMQHTHQVLRRLPCSRPCHHSSSTAGAPRASCPEQHRPSASKRLLDQLLGAHPCTSPPPACTAPTPRGGPALIPACSLLSSQGLPMRGWAGRALPPPPRWRPSQSRQALAKLGCTDLNEVLFWRFWIAAYPFCHLCNASFPSLARQAAHRHLQLLPSSIPPNTPRPTTIAAAGVIVLVAHTALCTVQPTWLS